jgi:hypothetical protein
MSTTCAWLRYSLWYLLSILPVLPPSRQRQSPKSRPVKLRTMRVKLHGCQSAQYASTRRQYIHLRSRKRRVTHHTSHPCVHSRTNVLPLHTSSCTSVHPYASTTVPCVHRYGIRPHLRAYTSMYLPTGMSYTFDSDSKVILVDNCCSTSITNDLHDFIAPPRPARAKVEGYNGTTTATMVGTVCWKIHDDLGNEHQLLLPNTYYSPEGNKTMPPTLGTDRQR